MKPLEILGLGSALPERVVTNAEVEALTGFPASRILELFEIDERRWSRGIDTADPPDGQRCSDLAIGAANAALSASGVRATEVGALVVVTTTPDSLNPPIDSLVARRLGMLGTPSFTLHAPCTGVFRAMTLTSALAPSLGGRPVLVVAADTPSPFFRFGPGIGTDQVLNSALYADGAGAIVVRTADVLAGSLPRIEAVDLSLNVDASEPAITFPGMLSSKPPSAERFASADYLGHHDFRRVLRRGSKLAVTAALRMMEKSGLAVGDVRYFITHQATGNIRRIGASYGLPAEKIPVNISKVGNTISASVLLLLDELSRDAALSHGDILILHTAESSTWSSAAMTIRW